MSNLEKFPQEKLDLDVDREIEKIKETVEDCRLELQNVTSELAEGEEYPGSKIYNKVREMLLKEKVIDKEENDMELEGFREDWTMFNENYKETYELLTKTDNKDIYKTKGGLYREVEVEPSSGIKNFFNKNKKVQKEETNKMSKSEALADFIKSLKSTMDRGLDKIEADITYGRNIHTVVEFIRHENPGKLDNGMSADFLTEEGIAKAKKTGEKVEELTIAGYASPKERAQQTSDLILDNTPEAVKVINRSIESLKGTGADNQSDQKATNTYRIKVRHELDALSNFDKIMPQAQAYAEQKISEGSKLDKYSLIVEYYLSDSWKADELKKPNEASRDIAQRAITEFGMTKRFKNNSNVKLLNVTHGPKLEPFLKDLIKFKSLDEIGGAIKPGEGLKFEININEFKQQKIELNFRDKIYEVSLMDVEKLTGSYDMIDFL